MLEPAQMLGIVEESRAERLDKQPGQKRIGAVKPAPEGDAVGLIEDTVGISQRQIAENGLAHELRMQGRDAVDVARADKGEIAHADAPVAMLLDERNGSDSLRVVADRLW